MSPMDRERHVLDLVIPRLEERGYTVFVQPPRSLLPEFMMGYAPDAVAIGKPRNLAIEVVQEGRPGDAKLASLQGRFAGQADWELRVYYYRPGGGDDPVAPPTRPAVEAALARVEALAIAGQTEAALLLGWSALEATARLLVPGKLDRPQAAGPLLARIAHEGVVTPEEAERLRGLQGLRNRIAHGDLDASVLPEQVADLVAIQRLALSEAGLEAVAH